MGSSFFAESPGISGLRDLRCSRILFTDIRYLFRPKVISGIFEVRATT